MLKQWLFSHFDFYRGGVERYRSLSKKYKNATIGLLKNLYKYKLYKLFSTYSCSLPVVSTIPESCIFPHGLHGIFISEGAVIGEKVIIYQQVTIGSNTLLDSKGCGAPSVGNGVLVGAGAKIIGNVSIGDDVRIGANCIVVKDVPSNCTVVIGMPVIIKHDIKKRNEYKTWNEFSAQRENVDLC